MKETERIRDQLIRSIKGPAWHGPALLELLAGVTADRAAARTLTRGHTMWELVLHIKAWQDAAVGYVTGKAVDLSDEEDFPPIANHSDDAWKAARDSMVHSARQLGDVILTLNDQGLDLPIPGKTFSAYTLLHGVPQHNLYHAGQIALLKK